MSAITTDATVHELMIERLGPERANWLLYNALQDSKYHIDLTGHEMGGSAFVDHMKRLRVTVPAGTYGHWDNEVLNLDMLIPEVIRDQVIGQPLGTIVQGAGLEDRIIKNIDVGKAASQVILEHREIADYDIPMKPSDKAKALLARSRGRMITTWREIKNKKPSRYELTLWWLLAIYIMTSPGEKGWSGWICPLIAVATSLQWLYFHYSQPSPSRE